MKDFWSFVLWLFWALCLCSALAVFGGVVEEYALPMYLCVAAFALIWSLKLFSVRDASWIHTPLNFAALALLAYIGIRCATAPLRHPAHWELLQVGSYALVYFAVAFTLHRSRYRAFALATLFALAALEAAYGFWQYATDTDRVFWFVRAAQYHGRGSGSFFCPNHLAGFLELVALILVAQLAVNPRPSKSLEHSFIVTSLKSFALIVALAGIVATGSRGSWLALTVGGAVFWWWAWRTRLFPPRVLDALVVLFLACAVGLLFVPSVRDRFAEAFSINLNYTFDYDILRIGNQPLEGRSQMNMATLGVIRDYPWFGTGPGSWRWFQAQYEPVPIGIAPQYAHNDLLQFVSEYGIVGVVLLGAALVCFCYQALVLSQHNQDNNDRALALGGLLAMSALLVHSIVDFNMHIPANAILMATLVGLVAGMSDVDNRFRRRRLPDVAKTILAAVLLLASVAIAWNSFCLCAAQRCYNNGRNSAMMRQWNDSIYWYHEALHLAPEFADARAAIADTYRVELIESVSNNTALAVQTVAAYQQALALNPRNGATLLRFAQLKMSLGDTNGAAADFQRLLAIDPNNAEHWVRYGQFLEQTGRKNEALRYYEKAATTTQHPEAPYLLGELRHELKSNQPKP
jgi:O-antigen ligase